MITSYVVWSVELVIRRLLEHSLCNIHSAVSQKPPGVVMIHADRANYLRPFPASVTLFFPLLPDTLVCDLLSVPQQKNTLTLQSVEPGPHH